MAYSINSAWKHHSSVLCVHPNSVSAHKTYGKGKEPKWELLGGGPIPRPPNRVATQCCHCYQSLLILQCALDSPTRKAVSLE